MTEQWKDLSVVDFPNYEVSNLGKVRNIRTKKLTNPGIGGIYKDRHYIQLYSSQKGHKCYTLHRLVALAFIENPHNYPDIDHIDGNSLNNCTNNLQWMPHQANAAKSFGGHKNRAAKLSPEDVQYIRTNCIKGHKTLGCSAFARALGVSPQTINGVVNFRSYKEEINE